MIEYGKDIMMENYGFFDINPLVCGEEICEPGHSFGPARREYYLLHYVFSGKGSMQKNGHAYTIQKGQIFVIRPQEYTTYTADKKHPWHYCWVGFQAKNSIAQILNEEVITLSNCSHIFRSLVHCDLQRGREFYICSKLFELFAQLSNRQHTTPNRTMQYVRMAQNYIESNYIKELRVDRLAESLNLDRSYFSNIFKHHTGKSPQQYIVEFRLEKAAELLWSQNISPGEAGQQVGYPDIYNFSRMFRKQYGVPPSRYRLFKFQQDKEEMLKK